MNQGWGLKRIQGEANRRAWDAMGDDERYHETRDGPRQHKRPWVIQAVSKHLTEEQGQAAVAWVKICHPKRSLGAERVDTCGNGTEAARVYALDHERQQAAVEQAVLTATNPDCVKALRAIGDMVTSAEFERRTMVRMERGGVRLIAATLDAVSSYLADTERDARNWNAGNTLDGGGRIAAKIR